MVLSVSNLYLNTISSSEKHLADTICKCGSAQLLIELLVQTFTTNLLVRISTREQQTFRWCLGGKNQGTFENRRGTEIRATHSSPFTDLCEPFSEDLILRVPKGTHGNSRTCCGLQTDWRWTQAEHDVIRKTLVWSGKGSDEIDECYIFIITQCAKKRTQIGTAAHNWQGQNSASHSLSHLITPCGHINADGRMHCFVLRWASLIVG